MKKEWLTFIALVLASAVIAISVSAVVGAMVYAGWMDDAVGRAHDCECCA